MSFNSAPDVSGERPPRVSRRTVSGAGASIRPQMYLGRDVNAIALPASFIVPLQFGPRCIWGETPAPEDEDVPRLRASIRPQMYLGRDADINRFKKSPEAASIRPQMYLGRDPRGRREFGPSHEASIRPQMYLGRDHVRQHERGRCLGASIRPQMYLGRDPALNDKLGGDCRMLQFGPRCIWGETTRRTFRCPASPTLQFGPRCIWGETLRVRCGSGARTRGFNSAPDVSGERLPEHLG